MGRPKQKARKSHGDESMGSGRAPSESSSISPHDGVTSSTGVGRGRKSMTSTSSRTPSPQMQPITIAPAMPVQLSPGGPYIVPNDGELRCDFCLLTATCNRNGQQEELLFCKDCQAKAHPSCMEYSEDLAARARNSPWQCIDCKTCYICEDSGDPDAMLFCDACDKGYHMDCHNPPVEEKPTGKWVCSKCVLELGVNSSQQMELDIDREVSRDSISTSTTDGPSCLPTPGNSPVPMQEGPPDQNANTVKTEMYKHKDMKKEVHKILSPIPMMNGHINPPLPQLSETLPLEVPDASEWSIDDVVNYFLAVGFTEQAEVFKEQEIDGKSLLLMKRSDVLTGLSLKLGPALKIYTHIQRLQTMGQNSHL